jgi:uracil-DNA glycosylase
VLLLNRSLTVAPRRPNSHQDKGWEAVTAQAITALAGRGTPLVAILWGRNARNLRPLLGPGVPCIESSHPSPRSADYGFFGSRPFSRANAALQSGRRTDRLAAALALLLYGFTSAARVSAARSASACVL